jgi:ubiquitin carboxyl-terminal hydrolase 34
MINFITNGIETIDSSGGHEHMNFFTQLCGIANERLNLDSRAFTELALENLPIYAPTLLIDRQESVRISMQDILLNEVLATGSNDATSQLGTQEIDDDEPKESDDNTHKILPEKRIALGRRIQRACAERLTAAFLKEQIRPIDGRQLESIMSVINFCLGAFYGETVEDEHEIKKTRGRFE